METTRPFPRSGDDPGRGMIRYDEALRIIDQIARHRAPGDEAVPLEAAPGRVLAEDVLSPEDVPFFDNSAMDGFAIRSSDTRAASRDQPLSFHVRGTIIAGDNPCSRPALGPRDVLEIMTGAPMPESTRESSLDAVVKLEDVEIVRDSRGKPVEIRITRPVSAGANVRLRGEDFRRGDPVAPAGIELQPEHLMAFASLGTGLVRVRRRPRVAIIATGSELRHHAERELAPGTIRNSTAPYLLHALPLFGAESRFYGIVRDDPKEFLSVLERATRDGADLVVSTGAVSMGKHDFVKEALLSAGAAIHFHKVAIRPGKPVLFAELRDGPAFFGSPGNPISTAVALRFFVAPYLRRALGLPPELPLRARLTRSFEKPEGLRSFLKARLLQEAGSLRVEPLDHQASFQVRSLIQANAWALLPEEARSVGEGTLIQALPLFPRGFTAGPLISGEEN